MDTKAKIIILILVALLGTCLFIFIQTYNSKQALEKEIVSLRNDNATLAMQAEQSLNEAKQLQNKLTAINAKLDRIIKEKNELQQKFELLQKERDDLDSKLQESVNEMNSRKILVHKTIVKQQEKIASLQNKVSELQVLLNSKSLEIDNLKKELGASAKTLTPTIEPEKGTIELPPIVVRPVETTQPQQEVTSVSTAKVLAVNRENNFVIIDLGEESGIKAGDSFQVYRDGSQIATIKVIQLRKSISACDITNETTAIKVGDTVK